MGKEVSTIINGVEIFTHSWQDKVVNIEELEKVFSKTPPEIVINASV